MKHAKIPTNLTFESITLKFDKFVEPIGNPELVPYYHFMIIDDQDNIIGHINVRTGDTRHIKLVAGNVGYEVKPKYRGKSASFKACMAIRPFLKKIFESVLLTAEIDNISSLKIIAKLGANYIDTIDVPEDDPAFKGGARKKRRYLWKINSTQLF